MASANDLLCTLAMSVASTYEVLVFQLIHSGGLDDGGNPEVIGWGAFPLVNAAGELIAGRFRLLLLRGPIDRSIVKFGQIEDKVIGNLDAWLANLYFDIRRLPHVLKDAKDGSSGVEIVLDEQPDWTIDSPPFLERKLVQAADRSKQLESYKSAGSLSYRLQRRI